MLYLRVLWVKGAALELKIGEGEKEFFQNFSIVVAARNEVESIQNLLDSFEIINYPKEHFEIIIVNDHSDDNTFGIVESVIHKCFTSCVMRFLNLNY